VPAPAVVTSVPAPAGVTSGAPPAGVTSGAPPAGVTSGAPPAGVTSGAPPAVVTSGAPPAVVTAAPAPPGGVTAARLGGPADSTRIRFVPRQLTLPGGDAAEVEPAQTVNGELVVPELVQHLGWWDGSSYAGDPFGSVVIAGHVDSAAQGLGFFAKLLRVKVGDQVTVRGDGHAADYRVSSVQSVAKGALAADSEAFDQTGDHRLVLITCTGTFDYDRHSYDSNLVVIAQPVGSAH